MIHKLVIVTLLAIVSICRGSESNQTSNQEVIPRRRPYGFDENPCTKNVEKPNFGTLGRRKSETKCLEYIWEISEKPMLIVEQGLKCNEYQLKLFLMGEGPEITLDIVGGHLVRPKDIPHMGGKRAVGALGNNDQQLYKSYADALPSDTKHIFAAIGWRSNEGGWIFKCGATIISPKFVLTAAHCTKSSRDSRISSQDPEIIRIGTVTLIPDNIYKDSAKNVEIDKIIPHPQYKSPKKYFDIALLELKRSENFNYDVVPVCLWTNIDITNLGTEISSSGWGVTEEGGHENSNVLRAAKLDIINHTVCHHLLQPKANRNWWGLADHQMCAGLLDGRVDSCQGDSGGPLQVPINLKTKLTIKPKMYYLLGVTSFGFGCARKRSPGVYTRVASVIDWIEETVWPNESSGGVIK